jgi:hypothetical protein
MWEMSEPTRSVSEGEANNGAEGRPTAVDGGAVTP